MRNRSKSSQEKINRTSLPDFFNACVTKYVVTISRKFPICTEPDGLIPDAHTKVWRSGWFWINSFAYFCAQCMLTLLCLYYWKSKKAPALKIVILRTRAIDSFVVPPLFADMLPGPPLRVRPLRLYPISVTGDPVIASLGVPPNSV
ncbi:hypothetical protein D3C75_725270 [compost metagenome]